jgi:hypothetical protein
VKRRIGYAVGAVLVVGSLGYLVYVVLSIIVSAVKLMEIGEASWL